MNSSCTSATLAFALLAIMPTTSVDMLGEGGTSSRRVVSARIALKPAALAVAVVVLLALLSLLLALALMALALALALAVVPTVALVLAVQ